MTTNDAPRAPRFLYLPVSGIAVALDHIVRVHVSRGPDRVYGLRIVMVRGDDVSIYDGPDGADFLAAVDALNITGGLA